MMQYDPERGLLTVSCDELLRFVSPSCDGDLPRLLPLLPGKDEGKERKSRLLTVSVPDAPFPLAVSGEVMQTDDMSVLEIESEPGVLKYVYPPKDRRFLFRGLLLAHLLSSEEKKVFLKIRYAYLGENGKTVQRYENVQTRENLSRVFGLLVSRALPFLRIAYGFYSETLPALSRMTFPYSAPRDAQKELMTSVHRCIRKNDRLLASVPTGVGKTMGVLFPALKALDSGEADKIFYLTAKTVTGKAAAEAVRDLSPQVPRLRVVPVYAKERLCPQKGDAPERLCRECPLRGEIDGVCEEDRLGEAVLDVLKEGHLLGHEVLTHFAAVHQVCPFELSLSVSEWCEVIVCDYNYFFDARMRLQRYFGSHPLIRKPVVLVDEAHNLPERVRSNFSCVISSAFLEETEREYEALRPADREYTESLRQILQTMSSYISLAENVQEDENGIRHAFGVSEESSINLLPPLEELIDRTMRRLSRSRDDALTSLLLKLYREANRWTDIIRSFDGKSRLLIETSGEELSLKCLCLDPSEKIAGFLEKASAAVFFSATMAPLPYYADLLGSPDAKTLDLDSPFDPSHLEILCADYISTRYSDRAQSAEEIAEAILCMAEGKEGHYLAYFPSYELLRKVGRLLVQMAPHLKIIVQNRSMNLRERSRFLHAFDTSPKKGEIMLGLCVLGGIFSEGIDLKGDRLIGVAVVGIGLSSLSSESNLLMEYYENTRESGKEYAYLYPGINRILQASGRVIRSENDRGVVLLIDDRYDDPGIQKLFPLHWRGMKFVGNAESLETVVRRFWEKGEKG
ncbi:MAG: ATP-dependent DNA helicase [Clostridia bacterium]|nr:ATP-dependent DNA helicase [Clostridia bacterium]